MQHTVKSIPRLLRVADGHQARVIKLPQARQKGRVLVRCSSAKAALCGCLRSVMYFAVICGDNSSVVGYNCNDFDVVLAGMDVMSMSRIFPPLVGTLTNGTRPVRIETSSTLSLLKSPPSMTSAPMSTASNSSRERSMKSMRTPFFRSMASEAGTRPPWHQNDTTSHDYPDPQQFQIS